MTTDTTTQLPNSPADLGFDPEKYDHWRPGQREVTQQIVDWYLDPSSPKVLFLEAPTGVGKSVIAGGAMRFLGNELGEMAHGIITTSTLNLQKQYVEDTLAPFAEHNVVVSAEGRSNYDCLILPGQPVSEGPCTHGFRCPQKAACTYYQRRDDAHEADIAVLNTAFYLTCVNYARTPMDMNFDGDRPHLYSNANLVIHDEAHLLERAVQNLVEADLPRQFFTNIGVEMPINKNHGAWHEFIEHHIVAVRNMADAYASLARMLAKDGQVPDDNVGKQAVRVAASMKRIAEELLPTQPLIEETPFGFKFRAVWGKSFAPQYLWRWADKHLLMSATIIHPEFIAESLGLQKHEWQAISMPSPFHPMKRRIVYKPAAKVTAKTSDQEFVAKVVDAIDEAIDQHPDQRGIIHSVSYSRANLIMQNSRHRKRMLSHASGNRNKQQAIEQYLARPGSILVSPAVGVGEDFGRGDNCRFQIFPKYPIPYLGDPVVRARSEQNSEAMWFEADMAFVQATGRGVRSADDYCVNYVFDAGARWRLSKLPQWIQESIVDAR